MSFRRSWELALYRAVKSFAILLGNT